MPKCIDSILNLGLVKFWVWVWVLVWVWVGVQTQTQDPSLFLGSNYLPRYHQGLCPKFTNPYSPRMHIYNSVRTIGVNQLLSGPIHPNFPPTHILRQVLSRRVRCLRRRILRIRATRHIRHIRHIQPTAVQVGRHVKTKPFRRRRHQRQAVCPLQEGGLVQGVILVVRDV